MPSKEHFQQRTKNCLRLEIVNKRTGGEEDSLHSARGRWKNLVVKTTKEKKDPITLPGINRTGWEATADSYQNASGDSDTPASNLLDGRTESIWHSNYGELDKVIGTIRIM